MIDGIHFRDRVILVVLGIDAHGSAGPSASPFCSSSMECLSGERTKAMTPSRGGRLMVTPAFISRSQTDVQPVFDAIVASAVRLLGADAGSLTRVAGDQIALGLSGAVIAGVNIPFTGVYDPNNNGGGDTNVKLGFKDMKNREAQEMYIEEVRRMLRDINLRYLRARTPNGTPATTTSIGQPRACKHHVAGDTETSSEAPSKAPSGMAIRSASAGVAAPQERQ